MSKPLDLTSRIREMMDMDTSYNYTPDLAIRRYGGPQNVFVFDQCQNAHWFAKHFGLDAGEDVFIETYNAVTMGKHIPVVDKVAKKEAPFKMFLFPTNDWPKNVLEHQKKRFSGEQPQHLAGRIYSLSLRALQKLDSHYANTILTERREHKFYRSNTFNPNDTLSAWVYLAKKTALMKWNPHKNEYRFGAGVVPTPCPRSWAGGKQRYEFNPYNQVG